MLPWTARINVARHNKFPFQWLKWRTGSKETGIWFGYGNKKEIRQDCYPVLYNSLLFSFIHSMKMYSFLSLLWFHWASASPCIKTLGLLMVITAISSIHAECVNCEDSLHHWAAITYITFKTLVNDMHMGWHFNDKHTIPLNTLIATPISYKTLKKAFSPNK